MILVTVVIMVNGHGDHGGHDGGLRSPDQSPFVKIMMVVIIIIMMMFLVVMMVVRMMMVSACQTSHLL